MSTLPLETATVPTSIFTIDDLVDEDLRFFFKTLFRGWVDVGSPAPLVEQSETVERPADLPSN
jgi:hypothetical protein